MDIVNKGSRFYNKDRIQTAQRIFLDQEEPDMKNTGSVQPFVRMVKIRKHKNLSDDFCDFDHVLVYLANGNITYSINGYSYKLDRGNILLIPPYLRHSVFNPDNEAATQYIIHFDFFSKSQRMELPHQSADDFFIMPETPECEKILKNQPWVFQLSEKNCFEYENLFLQAFHEFSEKKEYYNLSLEGILLQILVLLSRNKESYRKKADEGIKKNTKSLKMVQAAQEYIWLNYGSDINNTSIAEALGVSPNYLTKIFHRYTGMPLHKYLQNYRLEVARMMLSNGEHNVTEIARNCGFSTIHLFSRLFKKEFKVPPSEYMNLPLKENKGEKNDGGYHPRQQTYYN